MLCRGVLCYEPPFTRTRKVHWTNKKTWINLSIVLSCWRRTSQEHHTMEPFQEDSNWETRHSKRLSYFEIREVVTWGLLRASNMTGFLKQSAKPRDSWGRTKLIWLHCGRHKDDLPGSESLSCPTSVARSALGRGKKYISSFVKRRKSSMSAPRSWTWQAMMLISSDWFRDVQGIKAEALVHKRNTLEQAECTWMYIISHGHFILLVMLKWTWWRPRQSQCGWSLQTAQALPETMWERNLFEMIVLVWKQWRGVVTRGKKECTVKKLCHFILLQFHVSHEKNPLTFHYTGWLIGILIMVHYNPYITG